MVSGKTSVGGKTSWRNPVPGHPVISLLREYQVLGVVTVDAFTVDVSPTFIC